MRILIDEDRIQARVSEMASEIDFYYNYECGIFSYSQESVVVIGVLTGAFFFMADLVRQLSIPVQLDFIRTKAYTGKSITPQRPEILVPPAINLYDKHVLLIDDILDTGRTFKVITKYIQESNPKTITTAFLLRKPDKVPEDVVVDFVGFDISDSFVVGMGLDYGGLYRCLPHISVMDDENKD